MCGNNASSETYQTASVLKLQVEFSEAECFDLQFVVYFFLKCLHMGSTWITSFSVQKLRYTGAFQPYRTQFSGTPAAGKRSAIIAQLPWNCPINICKVYLCIYGTLIITPRYSTIVSQFWKTKAVSITSKPQIRADMLGCSVLWQSCCFVLHFRTPDS